MRRTAFLSVCAIAVVFSISPSSAQMSPSKCEILRQPIQYVSTTMANMLESSQRLDTNPIVAESTGDMKEAAKRFEESRIKLVAALKDFVASSEDLGYLIQRCARAGQN